MCDKEAEINDHLFLHCITTVNLWHMFLCILGNAKNFFTHVETLGMNEQKKKIKRRRVEIYSSLHLVDALEGKE